MNWRLLLSCCLIVLCVGCRRTTGPDNRAPYKPHNPEPLDGSVDQPVNGDLRWEGGDPDGDPVMYNVYFGTDASPQLVLSNVSIPGYEPGLLDTFTTYYWKITARDTNGSESEGDLWQFTTGNSPPFVPANPDPPDGSMDQSILLTASWTGGDPDGDTLSYYVYFGLSSPPQWVLTTDSAFYDPGVLSYFSTYYWKVVARDKHNNVAEGPIWSFTTWDTLPLPQNVIITSDTEGDGVILFWDQASSVDGYEVITPDRDTIILDYGETSYTDDSPSETGSYSICTFRGSEKSAPVNVSSAPFIGTFTVLLFVWSDPVQPAGFGWYPPLGNGSVYDCIDANKDSVDFYLNDSTAVFDFTSGDEPPYSGNKRTGILYMGFENFFEAPVGGYVNSDLVQGDGYYAMQVEGDYYGKIHVLTVVPGVSASFSFEFQKIQHVRIF